MTDSRSKGKRGELDAAKMIARATGCRAWRGRQHRGGADSPDVRTDPDGCRIEVKRTERLDLYAAVDQARRETPDAEQAVAVVHRRNGRPWVWIVPAERIEAFRQWLNDCAIHRCRDDSAVRDRDGKEQEPT